MIRFASPDRSILMIDDGSGTVFYHERGSLEYSRLALVAQPYIAPVLDPLEILQSERAAMRCTRTQGILALEEKTWASVMKYRNTKATWAQQVIIDSAQDWRRDSEDIAFFQWLFGMTDYEVDDLFRKAMAL